MQKTLKEIAEFVKGEVVGDESVVIKGVAGIREAQEGEITFLANPKYALFLNRTAASAVITSRDVEKAKKPIIRTDNPSLAFTQVISLLVPENPAHPQGIHPAAVVAKGATLGKDVSLGAHVVVEDGAVIGDNTVIYGNCYIGRGVRIGSKSLIYPNVTLREQVVLGERAIIHSGTVIGSDGFGFATVDEKHHKIPQVGTVEIGDDVEIGANCAIDRARFDKTVVGSGSKIDNLVHIAHNVTIGKNCLIVAQVGISGSTSIGDSVVLAGQVGIVGHVTIGDRAIVMAQSGVNKSIPADSVFWGYPAKEQSIAKRVNASVQNLPRLYDKVDELKKKIEELESKKEK